MDNLSVPVKGAARKMGAGWLLFGLDETAFARENAQSLLTIALTAAGCVLETTWVTQTDLDTADSSPPLPYGNTE